MTILYFAISLLFALTIHEAAHALVAYWLGDPTAKNQGRISLNPIVHLDPLGTILFLIAGIGWGKPVPVNSSYLKHPQRDNALIALAGPFANFLTAIICGYLLSFTNGTGPFVPLLATLKGISLVLIAFNLLPIPPLDGSKILSIVIPKSKYYTYEQFVNTNLVYLVIFFLFDAQFGQQIYGTSIISNTIFTISDWLDKITSFGGPLLF